MEIDELSVLNGTKLELHYWFNDNSHTMDAFVQNKCEHELLGILSEIAFIFDAEITIETEPLANGGLKRWFKIVSKYGKKSPIVTALIIALTTGVFITPITSSIGKVAEKLIEGIFEDKELKELEKEKLKLEIEELKRNIPKNIVSIDQNTKIKKRKSNFYEALEKYPKVEKISLLIEDENKNPISSEEIVNRVNFKEFILINDDLQPLEIDGAIIEIISPVLKKGKYKWIGIYNGETISFNMHSNEFKTNVQTGKIEFKNGSSINCLMSIRKKTDNEGVERTIGYDIIRVNQYFENEQPVETSEGKRHRQKLEMDNQQIKLF